MNKVGKQVMKSDSKGEGKGMEKGRSDSTNHAHLADLVPFPKMHSVWKVPKNRPHTNTFRVLDHSPASTQCHAR